jgi:hypothetical protein
MEEIINIRKKRYEEYMKKINEEKQQIIEKENLKIIKKEDEKDKIKILGMKIHNCKNIVEITKKLIEFQEKIETNIEFFEDYDFDDLRDIFNRVIKNMQDNMIFFNITNEEERKNSKKLEEVIKNILKILKLPEDLIDFDVQMDTEKDEEIAKNIMFDDIPRNELPNVLAEQLTNIFLH